MGFHKPSCHHKALFVGGGGTSGGGIEQSWRKVPLGSFFFRGHWWQDQLRLSLEGPGSVRFYTSLDLDIKILNESWTFQKLHVSLTLNNKPPFLTKATGFSSKGGWQGWQWGGPGPSDSYESCIISWSCFFRNFLNSQEVRMFKQVVPLWKFNS